ncbi:hypothetical protein GCM10027345_32030 [Hymenobacter daeguensis]
MSSVAGGAGVVGTGQNYGNTGGPSVARPNRLTARLQHKKTFYPVRGSSPFGQKLLLAEQNVFSGARVMGPLQPVQLRELRGPVYYFFQ